MSTGMAARIIDFTFACLSHKPFLAGSGLVILLVAVLMVTILAGEHCADAPQRIQEPHIAGVLN